MKQKNTTPELKTSDYYKTDERFWFQQAMHDVATGLIRSERSDYNAVLCSLYTEKELKKYDRWLYKMGRAFMNDFSEKYANVLNNVTFEHGPNLAGAFTNALQKERVAEAVATVFYDPMYAATFKDAPEFDLPLAGKFTNA